MKSFVGTIAQENFPTSDKREGTTITVPENLSSKQCDESIFCPQADRCDGIHCLSGDSDR